MIVVIGLGVVVVGLGWHLNRPATRAVSAAEPATETAPAAAGDAPQAVEPVAAQHEPPAQPAAALPLAKATSYTVAAPGFTYPGGRQAELFNSDNARTVLRHFEWMRDYGIDGAWLREQTLLAA